MKKIRKILTLTLSFMIALSLAACASNKDTIKKETKITLTDQAGRKVSLDKPATKIVSSYYITTYACLSLELGDKIVGLEQKADTRPIYEMAKPELLQLPQVGSMKGLNLEAIAKLEPDLVLLPMKLKDNIDALTDLGISVLVVNPESHEELVEMLELIGKATGKQNQAKELTDYYEKQINIIKEYSTAKQTVYIGSNSSYLETAPTGMYQSKLIETAGGVNAAKDIEGDYWTAVSYETLLQLNPEVIIVPSGATYSVQDILNDTQLTSLTAIKNKTVYQMPKGIEEWDSPIPSGILGTMWLTSILHENDYPFDNFVKDVSSFYKTFYKFDIDQSLIIK